MAILPGQAGSLQGPVADSFRNILWREPDAAGLDFYRQQLSSGTPLSQIQGTLANSPENQSFRAGPQVPQTGLIGSEQALQQGLGGSIDALMQGARQGRQDIRQGLGQANQSFEQGIAGLDPFAQGGQSAQQLQLAQSGALGPEAQAQAFQNFQDSPGQAFLQERGMRGINANASAMAGWVAAIDLKSYHGLTKAWLLRISATSLIDLEHYRVRA